MGPFWGRQPRGPLLLDWSSCSGGKHSASFESCHCFSFVVVILLLLSLSLPLGLQGASHLCLVPPGSVPRAAFPRTLTPGKTCSVRIRLETAAAACFAEGSHHMSLAEAQGVAAGKKTCLAVQFSVGLIEILISSNTGDSQLRGHTVSSPASECSLTSGIAEAKRLIAYRARVLDQVPDSPGWNCWPLQCSGRVLRGAGCAHTGRATALDPVQPTQH